MVYSFSCYGHENITGTHKNTFEFTKEQSLNVEGDCILGVKADFKLLKLKNYIKNKDKIKIIIKVDDLVEEIICNVNHDFNSFEEIVVRKTEFNSRRTLGVRANKACVDLNRELVKKLSEPGKEYTVVIE